MKTQMMTFGAMMVFGLSAVACAESPEETSQRTGSTVQELVTSKDAVSCTSQVLSWCDRRRVFRARAVLHFL